MRYEPAEITGLVLLQKIQYFIKNGDPSSWTFEKMKSHPPSYARLRQLDSLLKIFTPEIYVKDDFPNCFDAVLHGKFLSKRDLSIYSGLFSVMDSEIATQPFIPEKHGEWEEWFLCHNFTDLIEFRTQIELLRSHNSGIAEISFHYLYSVAVSEEFNRQMDLKKIDDFLWRVIDPEQRIFTKDQLVADFDYPEEEPWRLDMDEMDWW